MLLIGCLNELLGLVQTRSWVIFALLCKSRICLSCSIPILGVLFLYYPSMLVYLWRRFKQLFFFQTTVTSSNLSVHWQKGAKCQHNPWIVCLDRITIREVWEVWTSLYTNFNHQSVDWNWDLTLWLQELLISDTPVHGLRNMRFAMLWRFLSSQSNPRSRAHSRWSCKEDSGLLPRVHKLVKFATHSKSAL